MINKMITKFKNWLKGFHQREGFVPHTLSISRMCEKINKPGYYIQILNRIFREVEEYEAVAKYVRFDPNKFDDIYLDDDGICYFSDILMDYFGKKATLDIYRYVKALNKYSRHEYEFDCIFKSLSVKELKELEDKYLKYEVVPEQEEAKQGVIDRIRAELKSRKRIWI